MLGESKKHIFFDISDRTGIYLVTTTQLINNLALFTNDGVLDKESTSYNDIWH